MLSKITLALAFAFAVIYVVPASAGPRTCGYGAMQYDSSGTGLAPTATNSRRARSVRQHRNEKMAGRVAAIFSAGGIRRYAMGR